MRIELATGEELPPVIKRNDIYVVEEETVCCLSLDRAHV
jgi:hypothetical protein